MYLTGGLGLSFLLVSLLCGQSNGRIYHNNIGVRHSPSETYFGIPTSNILMNRGFGFLPGGELHFSMQCEYPNHLNEALAALPKPNFWLLFCSTADAREFNRMTQSQRNFDCHRLSEGGNQMARADAYCKRQRIFQNMSTSQAMNTYYQRMEYSDFYMFILLQCPDTTHTAANDTAAQQTESLYINCGSTLIAMNPGNVHLSSDEVPLPFIFTVIILVWGMLVAAWFFNWIIFYKYSNRLHRLISWAPVFKVAMVALNLLWWQKIAKTGVEDVDLADLAAVRHFVKSLEDAMLFVTMMVIAEGWGVVRAQIKHYRWTSLLLLFALFSTSLMCVHWVHRYFLAFSVCCVVFMLYKTLKWSSHNLELMRRRRRKMRRFVSRHQLRHLGRVSVDLQLENKLQLYQRFRIACVLFSASYAIAVTLSTFLAEYAWVRALSFELPELAIYITIGVLLRLRNFSAFEQVELVAPREPVLVLELPDVCYADVSPHVVLALPQSCTAEKETQTPPKRKWTRHSLRL